jgi:hypothetical protein
VRRSSSLPYRPLAQIWKQSGWFENYGAATVNETTDTSGGVGRKPPLVIEPFVRDLVIIVMLTDSEREFSR